MIRRLRHTSSAVRVGIALIVTVVACLLALALPAMASGGAQVAAVPCAGSLTTASSPDVSTAPEPSDALDNARQCGASPTGAQAHAEALLAGVGIVGFAGATFLHRPRRHPLAPA